MSSVAVRTLIRAFLESDSAEEVVDMTGQYDDLRGILEQENVAADAPWLGLDFVGNSEEPISLTANNTTGLYREFGIIQLHVCAVAKIGVGAELEARGEVLRDLFRGRRIGGIVVEKVSPINTGPGATLEFEAGYVSGTISVEYYYDKNL